MADCLFCKIAAHELDSTIVHESDRVVAFQDINPGAPTHVLVIPRRHIASARDLGPEDGDLLGEMFQVIGTLADAAKLDNGYRVVTNVGSDAGQSVHHLHFHLLGGRSMAWPPG
ncbi:MAG TPA: histidine triad nucleotide-binding protein [Actinomycetota bacterium]|nr:histidine triad nucleotide-binding protein [Actinomycetota bacterium]